MSIYARTLLRDWYMNDVCNCVNSSLEGIKTWTSYHFESSIERQAFLDTFEECQRIVKSHGMNPEEAVVALFEFQKNLKLSPKPPFFSRARWFYRPLEARLHAVQIAGELVEGISERYLP